jgi:hypothetical protein
MIGFFFKKAFFDGWDNLFALAGFNIAYLVLAAVFIVLPLSVGAGDAVTIAGMIVGILALSQWQALTAFSINDIADYRAPGFKAAFAYFPRTWKSGLVMGALNLGLWFTFTVGIPFYLSQKGFLASLLFWISLVALLASQYYLPLAARRGGSFKDTARISLILLMDNLGFTLFLFVYNVVTFALSALTAFMAPGPAGMALASTVAVKLRWKKYEWAEANPGLNRRKAPWDELLEEEKDLVGERTLRGMIFPWKDGK